eukprot:420298-Pyramimonas_sp.AAC.1
MAGDMINVRTDKVELIHPPSFQAWVDEIQSAAASAAKEELEARRRRQGDRAQIRLQIRALERRARL